MEETKYDSVNLLLVRTMENKNTIWKSPEGHALRTLICLQSRFGKSMRDFGHLETWPEVDFKISKKNVPIPLC